ncbi:MAG: restriction endonuclease [Deltaproteobacteria bacterium]|nr:restriction endonuclease [Deltaproteobacteria bacterium]
MTFTEAAVEILRRAGKPLHFNEIAQAAVRENLLSHVGQDPEAIMGQRLAAMARREEDRKVVAIEPEGTFALSEWKVPAEQVVEPVAPPAEPSEALEKPYRPKEREPRPIHQQARKRLEALQGITPDEPEPRQHKEREPKFRKQIPAEAAFEWLAARGTGSPLAELATALAQKGLISDALSHDLPSLSQALLEDNRRRTEAGRKPAFIVDGERVTLVEFPPPGAAIGDEARSPQTTMGRPVTAAQLVAEGRRATVRALRARLAELETSGFEQVCTALLEKMGMRDVRVAKRGKEGPLYLARQRMGLSDLRVAIRLVRGRREIGRTDVQELRKDLAHYSQQMGVVLASGEVGRDARGESSAAGQPPVALYAGEALAEELVTQHVGVTVQTVEVCDIDEAFFASATKASPPWRDRKEGDDLPAEAGAPAQADSPAPASNGGAPEAQTQPQGQPQPQGEGGRNGRPPRDEDRARRAPLRLTSAADQAWGQPAGTPKKSLLAAFEARNEGAAPQGEQPPQIESSAQAAPASTEPSEPAPAAAPPPAGEPPPGPAEGAPAAP